MDQSQIWSLVSGLFDTDDGSLPDISISKLHANEVSKVYRLVHDHSQLPTDSVMWDNEKQCDVQLSLVEDPDRCIAEYRCEPFAHEAVAFNYSGVTLPHQAIFVFQEQIDLFNRMGNEWKPIHVRAHFEFLLQIKQIAPSSYISHEYSADTVGTQFERAWLLFQTHERS